MAAAPPTTNGIPTAIDMESRTAPARKITLGRVVPAPIPEPISRPASMGPSNPPGPDSPVQVISSGVVDEDEDIVDLDEREDTPPRTKTHVPETRREAERPRSRQGLIDTQPEAMPYGTVSLPVSPPRITIPPRLSMNRSNSMNATSAPPVTTPNPYLVVENEDIVELDTREETPRPRVQIQQRHVAQRELEQGTSRQLIDQDMEESEDDDILPIELEPIPMPASPTPEAIPIPGIDRTYSMAQPMAVPEPPSKNYKQTTSIVAKARAIVRATKGTDGAVAKKGKGREREKEDGPDLKKGLSKLDAEVSSGVCLVDSESPMLTTNPRRSPRSTNRSNLCSNFKKNSGNSGKASSAKSRQRKHPLRRDYQVSTAQTMHDRLPRVMESPSRERCPRTGMRRITWAASNGRGKSSQNCGTSGASGTFGCVKRVSSMRAWTGESMSARRFHEADQN